MMKITFSLNRPLAVGVGLCLWMGSVGPSIAAACEGEGSGGGSLVPVPSTLNFGEQATGGKYEKFAEFEAVGENIATGGTLYKGRAEFSIPGATDGCNTVLVLAGKRCKVKVIFEPLAKELYTGEFKVPYETEVSHEKGTAVVHIEGKGK